ncbi:hypothetical protein [Xanthomonas sacchari]|uniref:hypothetical protein n=1 Tax=Xanthomonas sacchari TaxID=56458 RepID=UPI00225B588A|nr:hypothetical protein [Xanthomonas sacchari]MCW0370278.1 hypothetical protein [Xanthomonas sacchari]
MTQLDAMEKMVSEIREALQRRSDPAPKNVNTVRIEGMGAMWNGIAIGIALGAVIVATGWNVSKLQEMNVRSQQSEAYAKAVYMLAPRFAEAIDKELQRDKTIDQEAKDK